MSLKLIINKVTRVTAEGTVETLQLELGVNVLQGPPNSGKTVWLNIIDYVMGDTGLIEDALGTEDSTGKKLYDKYVSANMDITIGDKAFNLERKWNEAGARGKVFINGTATPAITFSDFILTELQIPLLHFPKGNPFAESTWPSLSWRMMLRHIYRREDFWSDLADRQPESEQHAVLAQFLGFAGNLFSKQFGDVIAKRKQLLRLEAEKEQFSNILDNIGKSMTAPGDQITFLTNSTIQKAIEDLEEKIKLLLEKRQEIINKDYAEMEKENKNAEQFILTKANERQALISQIYKLNEKQKGLIERIAEFKGIQSSITQEVGKLTRTKEAGTLFADLKITHCPACDQAVPPVSKHEGDCFLCHQHVNKEQITGRIEFEIAQLDAEKEEITELINSLQRDMDELTKHEKLLQNDLTMVERDIAPLRNKMSTLVSPEIGQLDVERGRYEEQIEGYKRVLINLAYKDELSKKIDSLNSEIVSLENTLNSTEEEINYEEAADVLDEEMTNYLNEIAKKNPERWPHKRPKLRIGEKNFVFKVNEGKWSKTIGATSKLYFLFAYHYGLLSLSKVENFNYPGLLIIDFPPELPNTEKNLLFNENYVVEPFVNVCKNSTTPLQVIITGNAFKDLKGAHVISVQSTWL